jgi:hypothetical protein
MGKSTVSISKNGRYFVDQLGNPFFWLGDTQWNLFRCFSFEEAKDIILNRKQLGFSFIQVMLPGIDVGIDEIAKAINGEAFPQMDPLSPNLVYFEYVESIINFAYENNIVLVIGIDHPNLKLLNEENAYLFGKWIDARYRKYPNIVYIPTYFIPEGSNLKVMREFARGILEVCGGSRLMSSHPDPANPVASSGMIHNDTWIAFNCIQTCASIGLIYESVSADYKREPSKPVVMAEGAYEGGEEYGYEVTSLLIRNQAYLSYFAGGYFSYGHNDNWRVRPTWRKALNSPGAFQMSVLRKVLTSLHWWDFTPDQMVFGEEITKRNNAVNTYYASVRLPKDDAVLVYISNVKRFSININRLSSYGFAFWIDPRDGRKIPAIGIPLLGTIMFDCPEEWEDALLQIGPAGLRW